VIGGRRLRPTAQFGGPFPRPWARDRVARGSRRRGGSPQFQDVARPSWCALDWLRGAGPGVGTLGLTFPPLRARSDSARGLYVLSCHLAMDLLHHQHLCWRCCAIWGFRSAGARKAVTDRQTGAAIGLARCCGLRVSASWSFWPYRLIRSSAGSTERCWAQSQLPAACSRHSIWVRGRKPCPDDALDVFASRPSSGVNVDVAALRYTLALGGAFFFLLPFDPHPVPTTPPHWRRFASWPFQPS